MAGAYPDEVAYRNLEDGSSITFARWERESSRLARGLLGRGVGRGDLVAICLESSRILDWIVTYNAVHMLGATAVPMNNRLSGPEVRAILDHFEDFRAKFLGKNKGIESPIPTNDFLKIKQDNVRNEKNNEIYKNFDESSIKLPTAPSFHKTNFDSANKNPMESESENDTEKNMVGSPIIQKSSRNYYTNSKIITNMHNRGNFKINDL